MYTIEAMESTWTVIDGMNGMSFYPEDFTIMDAIQDYGFEGICSLEIEYGWGARYTMPGFLDCTEWLGVFPTEESAIKVLKYTYDED